MSRTCGECARPLRSRTAKLCRACYSNDHGGLSAHPLYNTWNSMRVRCGHIGGARPLQLSYYRDRGIFVCEEWLANYSSFYRWMMDQGWRPGLQIDRIDNNGPYAPWNCRVVTRAVNNRNRRDNILDETRVREIKCRLIAGERNCDLARAFGVHQGLISAIRTGRAWRDVEPSCVEKGEATEALTG